MTLDKFEHIKRQKWKSLFKEDIFIGRGGKFLAKKPALRNSPVRQKLFKASGFADIFILTLTAA